MTDIGQKLLQALEDAPAKIREFVECNHEWSSGTVRYVGRERFNFSRVKCSKCGATRVRYRRTDGGL